MAEPATFDANQIIEITEGRLAGGMLPDARGAICTDSRLLQEGQWYLALAGEKFDGHDFLAEAYNKGALGAIVNERGAYAIGNKQFALIAVSDTLEAYLALAKAWRRQVAPLVVAVTGSSGKTTTKEMCASVFEANKRTHKSKANENNEYGLPKSILSMPDDTEVLVLELAMRGLGQIDQLAKCAEPDVGIIVNCGVAHLELLGTPANIIKAKFELLENMNPATGIGIIGKPTSDVIQRAKEVFQGPLKLFDEGLIHEVSVDADQTIFSDGDVNFVIQGHGLPIIQDAWCAIQAGRVGGLDDEQIAEGLKNWMPFAGRGRRLRTASGAWIIDETYNANPDSVKASVGSFVDDRVLSCQKKYVVLGTLAELGDKSEHLHYLLGLWLKDKPIAGLITIGKLAGSVAKGAIGASFEVLALDDQDEAKRALEARLDAQAGVLIKGSRSANLDKLVAMLAVPE